MSDVSVINLGYDVARVTRNTYDCKLELFQAETSDDGILYPAKHFTIYGDNALELLANFILENTKLRRDAIRKAAEDKNER